MLCALSNMNGAVPVPVVREGKRWGWRNCIYTKSVTFIQFQTGIYIIPDWHLYNSTLVFIQYHTGIYTISHWHLYKQLWHLYK